MIRRSLNKTYHNHANNVADTAIYIIFGLLSVEAEIHKKAMSQFGNRSGSDTIVGKIAERQISYSWFIEIKSEIGGPYGYSTNSNLTKEAWKSLIKKKTPMNIGL